MPLTQAEELELIQLLEEEDRDKARQSHLEFIQRTWPKALDEPFIIGHHTREISATIDEAFEKLRQGESSYYIINVHHRSGKSDMFSRFLAPHFVGEFPDREFIQTSYKTDLAITFSGYGRNILRSKKYQELYPDVKLSRETNRKNDWKIVNNNGVDMGGRVYATSLLSGLTGSGFSCGVIDDWFSGRADAESMVMREKIWNAFKDDFMTRRAPASIVFIIGTLWHWDGLANRIRNEMKKNPNFPRFQSLIFPAKRSDSLTPKKYPGKYLFLERYSLKWYEEQYATLGKYASAALLDCDPQMRMGAILSTDGIVYHDKNDPEIPSNTAIQWAQVWDLAHTEKQRSGDDPDWTSGTLLGFESVPGDPIYHLWIKKVSRCRKSPAKRDSFIKVLTMQAGKFVKHGIENSIESKDAYDYIKKAIPEYNWTSIPITGDKVVRSSPLSPIFEAEGHVHLIRDDWNEDWLNEILKFDGTGSGHDDQVDNLSAGYIMLIGDGGIRMSEKTRADLRARRRQ